MNAAKDLHAEVDLEGMDIEVDFDWPNKPLTGDLLQCHRASIKLLKTLYDSITASKEQICACPQEVLDLKPVVAMAITDDKKFRAQIGQIKKLVSEHGSLACVLESSIWVGEDAIEGLINLLELFDTFYNDLEDCMLETTITQDTLVELMGWVGANKAKKLKAVAARVMVLEGLML
jgi:hypothetical protein